MKRKKLPAEQIVSVIKQAEHQSIQTAHEGTSVILPPCQYY